LIASKGLHTYKKAELESFLQFHRAGEEPLCDDEISMLNGVLELKAKSVEQIMTPMKDVMTLSADAVLDDKLVEAILLSGYSRFPVHEPDDPDAFIGLLLVKKFLKYDPADTLPVSSFPLSILPEAHPTFDCFHALDYLGGAIGVEIFAEEIVDETDWIRLRIIFNRRANVTKQLAKRMTTASVMLGIVEHHQRESSRATGECTPLIARSRPVSMYGDAS
ncbi:hypothetical protein C8R44DRAFT_804026, partial [Mycena epipterygia]